MRTKRGIITSAKMTGTVTVTVHRSNFHPIYKKRFRISKKFLADSGEFKDLHEGDLVEITETRPLSKRKHFRVTSVIGKAAQVDELKEEAGVETLLHKNKEEADSSTES